ncbi:hypothetical protein L6164_035665 [Bauhinia variegata]|uniref:Uncharacterized protein n=1 Tax=Bauhinia variegata TaxID=167791 RepID=A0ACB9KEM8_BAUVA|nr:hypothetical protein L6164_035665 [Bauhinia variegata]
MYPAISEHEIYSAPASAHPSYAPPAVIPIYSPAVTANTPSYFSSTTIRSASTATRRWSTGLCRCLNDPANCLVTCCCPCVTFGLIAEIVDKGESSCVYSGAMYGLLALTGFACLYSCFYRSNMRAQYDLPEAPCMDCFVHFCCETCALCQEYRELHNHGFDMGIGWEANVERQRRRATAPPLVETSMRR